jgi:hypothetical protein
MNPHIHGVFGFLEAVPEESMPEDPMSGLLWEDTPREMRRKKLADFINGNFRLQWPGCPVRKALATYRLFFRDDMALALADAYLLHRCGQDPEPALTADFCPGFLGLLEELNIDDYRKADSENWKRRWWDHFSRFHEEGDRFVQYDRRSSTGYLLFRGDRLVWEMESCHLHVIGGTLRWITNKEKFISLGNTKGFLNGDFTWPPLDWVNPVTEEQEKAWEEDHTLAKIMERREKKAETSLP